MTAHSVIDLSCGQAVGVIIEASTGTLWSNQTGGIACAHPIVEGFFMPLSWKQGLGEHPFESLWGHTEKNDDNWEPYQRSKIGAWLDKAGLSNILQARESYVGEWGEAWIPVQVKTGLSTFDPFAKLEGRMGILTMQNSD